MSFDLDFVDSVAAVPTVRLRLNDYTPLSVMAEGTSWGLPPLEKSRTESQLVDGSWVASSAFGNRILTIQVKLPATDKDAAATQVQLIARELNRETNVLRFRPGSTKAVYFQCFRSEITGLDWDGVSSFATMQIEALPYAEGEPESGTVRVYNDPTENTTILNLNPYFETNATDWGSTGATFVRSTAQAHTGAASGLLTPDGVTATVLADTVSRPATVGTVYRASAWVRCAVARNVDIRISWRDGGGAQLSETTQTVAVAATTWTYVQVSGTAPASTAGAIMRFAMTGTPPAGNTLHIDEARLATTVPGGGGMYWDMPTILGDGDAPLAVTIANSGNVLSGMSIARRTVIAARRRGTAPGSAPFVLQAEAMTLGTDTTLPGNDQNASGAGSNYARCSFATVTTLAPRLTASTFPAASAPDVRGQYRVLARHRGSPAGAGGAQFQLQWGSSAHSQFNPVATADGFVTSTAWGWVDLGLIQFPQGADPETDLTGVPQSVLGTRIVVAISKASATQVDVDYLLFLPADDLYGAIYIQTIDSGSTAMVLDSARRVLYYVVGSSIKSNTAVPIQAGMPAVRPGAPNRFYFLLDQVTQTGGDQVSDWADLTWSYKPRYIFVRPVSS